MQTKLILAFLLTLGSNHAIAGSYTDTLSNNPVNHFQLLINNLNVIAITDSIANFDKESEKEVSQIYTRYSSTKNNQLVIKELYQAPVGLVSRAKCNEILESSFAKMLEKKSAAPLLLQMVSYFDMSINDAKAILRDSYLNVTVQSKENTELRISCQK